MKLQFRLRTLFKMVVVAALLFGWCAGRMRLQARFSKALQDSNEAQVRAEIAVAEANPRAEVLIVEARNAQRDAELSW